MVLLPKVTNGQSWLLAQAVSAQSSRLSTPVYKSPLCRVGLSFLKAENIITSVN